MIERLPSDLQLCFFSPLHRRSSPGKACTPPPFVSKVVLVSLPSATTQGRRGSEECWDVENDCADCDCACFTDGY